MEDLLKQLTAIEDERRAQHVTMIAEMKTKEAATIESRKARTNSMIARYDTLAAAGWEARRDARMLIMKPHIAQLTALNAATYDRSVGIFGGSVNNV